MVAGKTIEIGGISVSKFSKYEDLIVMPKKNVGKTSKKRKTDNFPKEKTKKKRKMSESTSKEIPRNTRRNSKAVESSSTEESSELSSITMLDSCEDINCGEEYSTSIITRKSEGLTLVPYMTNTSDILTESLKIRLPPNHFPVMNIPANHYDILH